MPRLLLTLSCAPVFSRMRAHRSEASAEELLPTESTMHCGRVSAILGLAAATVKLVAGQFPVASTLNSWLGNPQQQYPTTIKFADVLYTPQTSGGSGWKITVDQDGNAISSGYEGHPHGSNQGLYLPRNCLLYYSFGPLYAPIDTYKTGVSPAGPASDPST